MELRVVSSKPDYNFVIFLVMLAAISSNMLLTFLCRTHSCLKFGLCSETYEQENLRFVVFRY